MHCAAGLFLKFKLLKLQSLLFNVFFICFYGLLVFYALKMCKFFSFCNQLLLLFFVLRMGKFLVFFLIYFF